MSQDDDRRGSAEPADGDWRRPPGAAERRLAAVSAAGGGGLCPGCFYLRLVRSRRSVFLRCALAESDPAYPRYPSLPVLRCAGFERWVE